MYSIDFNENDDNDTGNSFINRIDSEILNCDLTDNIQIEMDKNQLDGNENENENENIIKLRRTKNRNNKNSHIITIMDDEMMNRYSGHTNATHANDTNTTTNLSSKWSEFAKTWFRFLPDITRENMKNVIWKIIMYLIMLYFLRKVIIEVKCF